MKSLVKSLKVLSLLGMLVGFIWTLKVKAANEVGFPTGNIADISLVGVVKLSTNSATPSETRQILTSDNGRLLTYDNVVYRSSWVTVNFTSNTPTINGIPTSTATTFSSSSGTTFSQPNLPNITTNTFVDNQHVFAICSSSQPCFYKGFITGQTGVTVSAPHIRIFDTRGSTATGLIWEGTIATTGTVPSPVNFDQFFSSGINILQDSGVALHRWAATKNGAQDGHSR